MLTSPKHGRPTAFEATPLYVDGRLYIGTPLGRVIALDPLTGRQIWAYDSKIPRDKGYGDYANRGVSLWQSSSRQRRVFIATIDAQLIALDAATGKPCADFGDNGIVNLRNGLRIAARDFGDYEETSPPAIVGSTIILGSGIADNRSANQPSGEVRGFDVVSGKLKWTFDPIPQNPKAVGADTWKNGSAQRTGAGNAWSVIAADPQRNLVFVPTGGASRIFTAASAWETIFLQIPSWPCAPTPANGCGISRPCITIFGITMLRRRPFCLTFTAAARRFQPSASAPKPLTSLS